MSSNQNQEQVIEQLVNTTNSLINLIKVQETQIRFLTKICNQIYLDVEKSAPGMTTQDLKKLLVDLNKSFEVKR